MFDEAGEDELLLAAMMRLGAAGGSIGAGIGGSITGQRGLGAAGARGGARGAARGYKRTKKDVSTGAVSLDGPLETAARTVAETLATVGNPVGTQTREDGAIAMRAMLGVGLGGLNPVVVTAVLSPARDGSVQVAVRTAGREGLIKQHPADKALAKVIAALNDGRPGPGAVA